MKEVDARESQGVCWARYQIQQLWQGEEYTLQIDSHMRFEPGWDDTLLSMWKDCGSEKSVLTCYPPAFTPPDTFEREWIFGMAAKEFDEAGIFLMQEHAALRRGRAFRRKAVTGGVCVGLHVVCAVEHYRAMCAYRPVIVYFFGEEIMPWRRGCGRTAMIFSIPTGW